MFVEKCDKIDFQPRGALQTFLPIISWKGPIRGFYWSGPGDQVTDNDGTLGATGKLQADRVV